MKKLLTVLLFGLFQVACGSETDFLATSNAYQTNPRLSINGSVALSYQQVSLFRSIALDNEQPARCQTIGQDYSERNGVQLEPSSLTISYEGPGKHCARRNTFNQCETTQYIYTFTCTFRTLPAAPAAQP